MLRLWMVVEGVTKHYDTGSCNWTYRWLGLDVLLDVSIVITLFGRVLDVYECGVRI